jgi:hypothetical protein
MRAKVRKVSAPETALPRIVEALERELIEASDEEVLEAVRALGMNPGMKGSAAFAGLKYFAKPQLSDFFEFEICRHLQGQIGRTSPAAPILEDSDIPQAKPSEGPSDEKNAASEESS